MADSDRTRFIEHAGQRILLQDFSFCDDKHEALRQIAAAKDFVARQNLAPGSLRILTLTQESRFDSEIIDAIKDLAMHHKPYAIAGAVVGLSPIQRVMYRMINTFTGRRLAAFDDVEEAKAWLVRQRAST
ncbi:MAG TPA: hypothetical protein VLW85_06585 [Myxococcales bacterium]|nr:hypothetical protein [Myxococcales bacterium]